MNKREMDFNKLTATNEWIKGCESSTDLSIILKVSLRYAVNNEKKHTKYQLIELYKICHEMACLLKTKMTARRVCQKIGLLYFDIQRFNDALYYLKKCLSMCQETGDLAGERMSYSNIGRVYYSLGQYGVAMEYYKNHLSICQEMGDLARKGTSCCSIGNVYARLGQYEKAMEYYKKHLSICQETRDLAEERMSYSNIGRVYYSLGQYGVAMEYYKKHLSICQEMGDLARQGTSCCSIGNIYARLGQYEKAMEYHKKHLSICQETGDLAGEGTSYGNIGNVYHCLGQYEKAMEYHKKDLSIFQETGNLAGEGGSYCNMGNVYQSVGQYEKAMEYHKKQLSICQETGDLTGKGTSYCNIGNVYGSLGQYEKAMEYHIKDLTICQETGNLAGEGTSYGNIGNVYSSLGQYETAMEYHKKHLSICQQTGDLTGKGMSYGNIGNVHSSLGQYEKAMEYHKKHLSICQETGDLTGEGKSCGNIGIVYRSLGQYEKAMECHKKHLSICQETGDLTEKGTSYGNIGNVYHLLGQYEKAMEYHKKELSIYQETGDLTGKGTSYGNTGNVYQSLGQYEKAMEYLTKNLSICQETGDLAGEGTSYCNIGGVCLENGYISAAEASLKESLRCFQKIFNLLHQQDDWKVSIVDTYVVVYHLLTEVLMLSGKEEEALLVSERGRSQALRDKLMMKYGLSKDEEDSELLNKDIDSWVSSSGSSFLFLSLRPFNVPKVSMFVLEQGKELYLRETLTDSFAFCANSDCTSTALPDILKSYVNKMLQDANKYLSARNISCEDRSMDQHQDQYPLQHLALDILSVDDVESVTSMEDNVTSWVSSYSRAPTEHSDKNNATGEPQSKEAQASQNGAEVFEKMYQVLIAPVQEALTKPEIVIIPDGPLFFVPFAALKDKNGHFLSETKRIRLGPSLTTLKILKECPAESHCKTGALIVGGPVAEDVMYRGKMTTFDDLPFARKEARLIGRLLRGEKILMTKYSATKDEVIRRLQEGVSIIHIATHSNAATGELVLAPGPCSGEEIPKEEDYMLTVKDIYSRRINAKLVVLSCCHSGRGKIRAEGVVGLTRAFLAAGARSVLATLWAINDVAALYFMDAFYRHLTSGESASASLQQAMEKMRKIPVFSHPYYWAPFFIVGDDISITT